MSPITISIASTTCRAIASKETVIPLENLYSLKKGENQVMYFNEIYFRECNDYYHTGS